MRFFLKCSFIAIVFLSLFSCKSPRECIRKIGERGCNVCHLEHSVWTCQEKGCIEEDKDLANKCLEYR